MTYNTKIENLRKEWIANPDNRKVIELRARLLKMALAKSKTSNPEELRIFSAII